MPNRILKESICTSENLNNVSTGAEVLFYRLIVNCDDYGRMDGRLPIIRAKCYPLRLDNIHEKEIDTWLKELQASELLKVYTVLGQNYIAFTTWDSHQQIRAKRSRYPNPNGSKPSASDNTCEQLKADDSSSNLVRARENTIQSNPNTIQSNKNIYGEFNNVLLTDEEYQKLITRFKETGTKERIEGLSTAIASKGYKYKSHYATILSWERMNGKSPKTKSKFNDGWQG